MRQGALNDNVDAVPHGIERGGEAVAGIAQTHDSKPLRAKPFNELPFVGIATLAQQVEEGIVKVRPGQFARRGRQVKPRAMPATEKRREVDR